MDSKYIFWNSETNNEHKTINTMEKEFKVVVRTFRGYTTAPREKAIKVAKAMITDIIEDGFSEEHQWANFIKEGTQENLGLVKMTDGTLVGYDLNPRIATLKALLA